MGEDWRKQLNKKAENLGIQTQPQREQTTVATTEGDYVKEAESIMIGLKRTDRYGNSVINITTSKLRNILTLINQIYNEVILSKDEHLSEAMQDKIRYLKIRIVYEAGRESSVKEFVEKAKLLGKIESIKTSRKKFLEFSRFMEALVAYHRFYGGKD